MCELKLHFNRWSSIRGIFNLNEGWIDLVNVRSYDILL
jgi:hypothetical protein